MVDVAQDGAAQGVHAHRLEHVSVLNARFVLNAAERAGVDRDALLAAAGLRADQLDDPEQRIHYMHVAALWESTSRLTGDEAFGLHLAESLRPRDFGALGLVVRSCATAGEALERVVEYSRRALPETEVALESDGKMAHLIHCYRGSVPGTRQVADLILAMMVVSGRQFIGVDWTPIRVGFRHSPTSYVDQYQRVFRAPVSFDQPRNILSFDGALLERPMLKADSELLSVIEGYAEEFVEGLAGAPAFSERVRELLALAFDGGDPGLAAIAAKLELAPRTLQRRLRQEGTSHRELLDGVREALASRYLRDPSLSVEQVAARLGFSEPSAFHRAFRRWTGTTPAAFRASLSRRRLPSTLSPSLR